MIVMSWIFLIPFGYMSVHLARRMTTQTNRFNFVLVFLTLLLSVAITATSAGVIWGGLLK